MNVKENVQESEKGISITASLKHLAVSFFQGIWVMWIPRRLFCSTRC